MNAVPRLPILAVVLVAAAPADAGIVLWGPATNISGDGDVGTLGTLVGAVNIGDTGIPATTVNGVTFTPFPINSQNSTTTISDPTGRFTLAGPSVRGFSGFGVDAAPFNTLSPALQTLLTGGDFGNSNSLHLLTIGGLIPGADYEFQVWANDSRSSLHTITGATAGNTVDVDANVGFTFGGIGQFAVGTFTADAATQDVSFQGILGGTIESAYQLRLLSVPEPGSGLLVPTAVAAFVLRRSRSRAR
jgi:hypothetical protein